MLRRGGLTMTVLLFGAWYLASAAHADTCSDYAAKYNTLLDSQKTITHRLKAAKECSAEFFQASAETSESYARAEISRRIVAECPTMKPVSAEELIGLATKMTETTKRLKGVC